MIRVLYILLFLFFFPSLQAQTDETRSIMAYIQKAMNFNKVEPQEKVYLHFDNMGYFENETMWFKAYVTRSDCGKPTDLSKVLYVELLNPSGDVIKERKYPIDYLGMAHGEIKLDTLLNSGFYEVRAYTRYMTNWGTNAIFSRVFPVFRVARDPGTFKDLRIGNWHYGHRDPNNRDSQDSLYQNAIDNGIDPRNLETKINVQFYPEGGDLIVGKKCRVAILAVDDNGSPHDETGYVTNANGDVLASVETDTLGRGVFEITPGNTTLTLQMRNLKKRGKTVQNFTLPKARKEGCVLNIDAVSDDMLASLQCTDSVCGSLLGYVVMHNGNIIQCDTMQAAPLIEIELDRQMLPEGVNQLTVFDHFGRIMAERLFFLCPKSDENDSIHITSNTQRLKPCGPVELELRTQPHANLSFSAMDAHTLNSGKQGNMKTWMLLSSEVKGYIHNVDYYFETDDQEHRQTSDFLMLTQGWRRYDWRLMTEKYRFRDPQPIEDKFYLSGKLNVYRKRNPVNGVHLQALLYNKDGQSLIGNTVTDENGNYAFEMPFIDGEWKMYIFTRKEGKDQETKNKTYYVGINRQFSPTPRFITTTETTVQHPLKPNAFVVNPLNPIPEEDEFIPITQKNIVLSNVNVKAKRRYFTNDDFKYQNENYGRVGASIYYNIDKELDKILDRGEPEPTIFEFLCKKNAFFNNPECHGLPDRGELKSEKLDKKSNTGEVEVVSGGDDLIDAYNYSNMNLWTGAISYDHKPIKWVVDNGETKEEGMVSSKSGAIGDIDFQPMMGEYKSIYISPDTTLTCFSPEAFIFVKYAQDLEQLKRILEEKSYKDTPGAIIHLYKHHSFSTESNKGIRRTYFQGFNVPETFKTEDYSVIPPMADFRRTLWWQPDVKTDENGKATIKFYNNSTCEEMYISVEGMDENGRVLVNE